MLSELKAGRFTGAKCSTHWRLPASERWRERRPRAQCISAASPGGDARNGLGGGLSGRAVGLRIGFLTDLHRSQTVSHEMAERAVRRCLPSNPTSSSSAATTSPRAIVATSARGRSARAADRAARRLRRPGQPRRRSGHAGGAGIARHHDAAGCADRSHRSRGNARPCGIRYWTRKSATSHAWFAAHRPT